MELLSIILFSSLMFSFWWLYFFEYRPLVVAQTRQRLFRVRDELFQKAATGIVAFDSEAYRIIRRMLNGSIRFTHELTLLHAVLLLMRSRSKDVRQDALKLHSHLKQEIDRLPSEDAKQAITRAFLEMHICLLTHIINNSLVLRVALFLIERLAKMLGRVFRYSATIKKLEENKKTSSAIALIESESYEAAIDPQYDYACAA